MLSTLERHILARLIRLFVPVLLGTCALFGLAATLRLLQMSELSAYQVALLIPWVLPFLLPYLVPLAYAATVALVLGRMVADQEVLAYVSLGVPRRSLAWPAVLLAVPLTALMAWIGATVVPHCYQRRKEAGQAVFEQFRSLGEGEHLSHTFPSRGFGLYVRRHGPEGLEGVVLFSDAPAPKSIDDQVVIVARRGAIDLDDAGGLTLLLEDVTGTVQRREDPTGPPIRMRLDRYVQRIGLSGRRRLKEQDYSTADLRARSALGARRERLAAAHGGAAAFLVADDRGAFHAGLEVATRVALAAAPLVLALLVSGLTFLVQARSPLVPLVLGLGGSAALYFFPLLVGRSLGEHLALPALPLAACAVALVAGLLAARRAERPPGGNA
ncbi:MAG: LptF/LptG family permease, partial [Planctomycetes bacterium]|nr:LptF/LptG family permease [Planctomycetota bacterium]